MKKILALLSVVLLLGGCAGPAPVMTVDGYEVSRDLYRYYYRSMLDEYNDEATARAEAVELLRSHVVILRFAEQYGVTLTQEELDEIDSQLRSAKGRNEDFAERLEEQHITEELYPELCRHDSLRQKLMAHLREQAFAVTEERMRTVIAEEFICARHIFFDSTVDGAADAAAQAAQELDAGASFDELFIEYMGQDYSQEPYLFGRGYMVEEFDAAARDLAIGQVSGAVSTAYGWHIIQRLPLDDAYIEQNLAAITEEYVQTQISLAMAQAAAEYEIRELS